MDRGKSSLFTSSMARIAVVGAGVIGLSTAVQLQKALPKASVTIIADKFGKQTTSDGAAGIFRPTFRLIQGVPPETLRRWCKDSWDHYTKIADSPDSGVAGVYYITGYQFSNEILEDFSDGLLRECSVQMRATTPGEHALYAGPKYKHGMCLTTVMAECRFYLPYLMRRFKHRGGRVEHRTISSFEELAGKYDVVMNCCGLKNRELLGDKQIYAIRGQMIRTKMPWLKHFIFIGHNTWIVPGIETTTIGGTRQKDNYNMEVVEQDTEDVFNKAAAVLPSVKKSDIQWISVGLRPNRFPVRLEAEDLNYNGKTLQVIHNYGHGGNGVALSWGSAGHAVRLAVQTLARQAQSKL